MVVLYAYCFECSVLVKSWN